MQVRTRSDAAGFAFDVSHSYTLPILVGAGANMIAAGILAGAAKARLG